MSSTYEIALVKQRNVIKICFLFVCLANFVVSTIEVKLTLSETVRMAQPGGGLSVTLTFWQYANVPIVPVNLGGIVSDQTFYVVATYFVRVATRPGSNDWRKRSVLVLLGML